MERPEETALRGTDVNILDAGDDGAALAERAVQAAETARVTQSETGSAAAGSPAAVPFRTVSVPAPGAKAPFRPSKVETACALLSYVMAYSWTWHSESPVALLITAALLVLSCELLQRSGPKDGTSLGQTAPRESLVWLGCLALLVFALFMNKTALYGIRIGERYLVPAMGYAPYEAITGGIPAASGGLSFCRVWDEEQLELFVHVFAVWWVVSRSGKLLRGESSRYLPADAVNAFALIPFRNIFLRVSAAVRALRSLFGKAAGLRRAESEEQRGRIRDAVFYTAAALIASAALLRTAASMLSNADAGFEDLGARLIELLDFDFDPDPETVIRIIVSLPVGAYLYGLTAGSARLPKERLRDQLSSIDRMLAEIRKVPQGFWTAVIAAFSAMYAAFFALQAGYLFGAFTRTLPEGFIVSEYARRGFFDLCGVMTVNFSLLWLVTRMAAGGIGHKHAGTDDAGTLPDAGEAVPGSAEERSEGRLSPVLKSACLALLAESAVFAAIAFSKLALYIDCFGFTPLRFQSLWLVCVLFAACALWTAELIRGCRVFKTWMYFGAVSLALLSLY